MPQLGSVPSKQVQLKHISDRGLEPQLLSKFGDISEKKIAIYRYSNQILPLFRAI